MADNQNSAQKLTNEKIDFLVNEFGRLDKMKEPFRQLYTDLGKYEGSHLNSFYDSKNPAGMHGIGEKKNTKMFDSTYPMAARRYASICESFLTPRTQKWHMLNSTNDELNKSRTANTFFHDATNYMFEKRYATTSSFASQFHEALLSFAVFGTGCLYVGYEMVGENKQIYYKSIHISQIYIDEDEKGMVNTLIRRFPMKLSEIKEKFGDEHWTSSMHSMYKKDPHHRINVNHRVAPNTDFEKGMFGVKGKKFISQYYCTEEKIMFSEGGYNTFPYCVIRDLTSPNEVFGRGPAINTLPDIKMLNSIMKTLIIASHRTVSPPILTLEDGAISTPKLAPASLIRGGIDEQGRPLVQPFDVRSDIPIGFEMLERVRRSINDAFFVTLFQILLDTPQKTATEVLELAQEKGALLSPTLGRVQTECLGGLIVRELDIFKDNSDFPELPADVSLDDGEFKVVYDSPFDRALKAEESSGIMRAYETILPIADREPEVMDNFDSDEAVKILLLNGGVTPHVIRDKNKVSQIRKGRAQAQNNAAQVEQAESASNVVKNLAQADKFRGDV